MLPQLGKHSYRASRWRTKAIATLCGVFVFVAFTHLFHPNLRVLQPTQLYSFDRSGVSLKSTAGGSHHHSPDDPDPDSTEPISPIPRKIWQNYFSRDIDEDSLRDASSWIVLNRDYRYTLIGRDGANKFVDRNFADDPALVKRYHSLPNFAMMSDLLRYMVLYIEGGTYTDIDTTALQPIRNWVAPEHRADVRAIIGIEYDQRDGGGWVDISHEVQFCQWTLAAAPGHPLFGRMIRRALWSFGELERVHNGTALVRQHPSNFEVLNSTGPAAFTDVVFDYLRDTNPGVITNLRNFSYITEPALYGDVLILPIDGFGVGQPHSNSSPNQPPFPDSAFVKHNFHGGWKVDHLKQDDEDEITGQSEETI